MEATRAVGRLGWCGPAVAERRGKGVDERLRRAFAWLDVGITW